MSWNKPPVDQFWRAVEIYVRIAYGQSKLSGATQKRIETLRATGNDDIYSSPVFERDHPDSPKRLSLRLGNPTYPHMKLVVEAKPNGQGYLFRVDTHDRHCRPSPESREYRLFCELTENNLKVAEAIECAWTHDHVPTFKEFLREDLAARAATHHQPH